MNKQQFPTRSFISEVYIDHLTNDLKTILDNIQQQISAFPALNSDSWDNITFSSKYPNKKSFSKLEDFIYNEFYKRSYLYAPVNTSLRISLETIKNHNKDQEEGWTLNQNIDTSGCITIEKFDEFYLKKLFPGTYIKGLLMQNLFRDKEAIFIQWVEKSKNRFFDGSDDQYFRFYGETLPDEFIISKNHIRFYFNLDPNATHLETKIIAFAELLFEKLNKRKVPFECKIHKLFYLADSCVLYVERRYFVIVMSVITENYFEFSNILKNEVPMFTYPLIQGVGFAENPDILLFDEEISFGLSKSAEVATIIKNIFPQPTAVKSDNKIINNILNKIAEISKKKKYQNRYFLNPTSRFEYHFKKFTNQSISSTSSMDSTYLEYATKIGYLICKEAFWDNSGCCNWVGYNATNKNYKTLNTGLLEGLAGTILFLSELFNQTNKLFFKRFVIGALKTYFIKSGQNSFRHGFHGGTAGELWAIKKSLENIAFEDNTIQKQFKVDFAKILKNFVENINKNAVGSSPTDVFGGISGTLLGLILIFDKPDKTICDAIFKEIQSRKKHTIANTFLIKLFPAISNKTTWEVDEYAKSVMASQKLMDGFTLGLGHGSSGITTVLYYYGQKFDVDVSTLLYDQIVLEEAMVSPNTNVLIYPDFSNGTLFRLPLENWEFSYIGIGISRLPINKGRNFFHNGVVTLDTESGIKKIKDYILKFSILSNKFHKVKTGLIDLMIDLASDDSAVKDKLNEALKDVFTQIDKDTFYINITENQCFHPGLIGFSGLGYELLRLDSPNLVQSFYLPSLKKEFLLK
jgi:hypothetical protein